MAKTYTRAAMFLLAASVAVPLFLVVLPGHMVASAQVVAPCHQKAPVTGTPSMPNHDCCIVGHNKAAPSHAAVLPAPIGIIAQHLAAVSPASSTPPSREPALTSFDPPANELPLRI